MSNVNNQEKELIRKDNLNRKLEKFNAYLTAVNNSQSLGFRSITLVFVFFIELAFFVVIFNRIPVDGALITAMTIVAVLPILVMRTFDITALSLTKEGITSAMSQIEQEKLASVITDNPIGGEASIIKFGSVETGPAVTIRTDKFLRIESNGVIYKLALVE